MLDFRESVVIRKEVTYLSGSELFWASGTWLLFVGQVVAFLIIIGVYCYQGKKEREARRNQS